MFHNRLCNFKARRFFARFSLLHPHASARSIKDQAVVDRRLCVLDLPVEAEELLVKVRHAHRLQSLHVALAHCRKRHRISCERVHKLRHTRARLE